MVRLIKKIIFGFEASMRVRLDDRLTVIDGEPKQYAGCAIIFLYQLKYEI